MPHNKTSVLQRETCRREQLPVAAGQAPSTPGKIAAAIVFRLSAPAGIADAAGFCSVPLTSVKVTFHAFLTGL